ncbi:DNA alkylation repair protein [Mariniphaga sediminis]|uniref:DNA alkylation repair protein n=1 Tax=Mariniphaga sediminis TaxID=1628158 RepID=A0A399D400_9BACT|nr:DNA alkylation repair protein [Mariniphaga sediminis]RIH66297.1 DNA alkylation repair protein [Mariniphaga sediminis]
MDFLLDNPETEKEYQRLLRQVKVRKNGEVSALMKRQGIEYKLNWGVSVVELRELAQELNPDHLLALKLWNKQWRETMILATLLDEPEKVTEEQMDFWTKSFENREVAEQASANLWVKTRYAFVKAIEWSRGKKHLVRFTGVHLMGRLAITQKEAIDEMFEPFFEELAVVGKDSRLNAVIYRAVLALGARSKLLNNQALELAKTFQLYEQEDTVKLGEMLFDELTAITFH